MAAPEMRQLDPSIAELERDALAEGAVGRRDARLHELRGGLGHGCRQGDLRRLAFFAEAGGASLVAPHLDRPEGGVAERVVVVVMRVGDDEPASSEPADFRRQLAALALRAAGVDDQRRFTSDDQPDGHVVLGETAEEDVIGHLAPGPSRAPGAGRAMRPHRDSTEPSFSSDLRRLVGQGVGHRVEREQGALEAGRADLDADQVEQVVGRHLLDLLDRLALDLVGQQRGAGLADGAAPAGEGDLAHDPVRDARASS